jgi:hypothetical protein
MSKVEPKSESHEKNGAADEVFNVNKQLSNTSVHLE